MAADYFVSLESGNDNLPVLFQAADNWRELIVPCYTEDRTFGWAIFDREKVKVEVFFAPSHTFDENTIHALKVIGITSISDGYCLFPFNAHGILFVPQLVGRPAAFPFGVYTSCHHLNHFAEADFSRLEKFVKRNHARILSYSQAMELVKDSRWNLLSGAVLKRVLQAKRGVGRVLDGYRKVKLYGSGPH